MLFSEEVRFLVSHGNPIPGSPAGFCQINVFCSPGEKSTWVLLQATCGEREGLPPHTHTYISKRMRIDRMWIRGLSITYSNAVLREFNLKNKTS